MQKYFRVAILLEEPVTEKNQMQSHNSIVSSKFGEQKYFQTPNRGWARYYPKSNRYEVGSHMWSNGGDSILGYAYNQDRLQELLQEAELKSAQSKLNAESNGAAFAAVPTGFMVSDTGELEPGDDSLDFNSDLY